MSRVHEFIKECGVFYVLSVNGKYPAGRPFGAIMEYEDHLYISTGEGKDVCVQLREQGEMQIIALKPGTREWIRVSGIANECRDLAAKQAMLKECPDLNKRFSAADDKNFVVFRIADSEAWLHTDEGKLLCV